MGCDIHDFVEVRKDGKWVPTGPIFPYEFHDPEKPSNVLRCWTGEKFVDNYHKDRGEPCDEDSCYIDNETHDEHPYGGRNYNLFSILADVRNGSGFAGCDTGDGFVPISMPKGLPSDCSPEIRAKSEKYGPDGHSHSWLTLAEIEAYDWSQKTKHRGWVDAWNFDVWRKKGKPHNWCGGVSGPAIEHVSNQAVARLIDSGEIQWIGPEPEEGSYSGREYTTGLQRTMQGWGLKPGSIGESMAKEGTKYYTLVEWEEPYSASVNTFLIETVPLLKTLGKPEDVRMVFWFDN